MQPSPTLCSYHITFLLPPSLSSFCVAGTYANSWEREEVDPNKTTAKKHGLLSSRLNWVPHPPPTQVSVSQVAQVGWRGGGRTQFRQLNRKSSIPDTLIYCIIPLRRLRIYFVYEDGGFTPNLSVHNITCSAQQVLAVPGKFRICFSLFFIHGYRVPEQKLEPEIFYQFSKSPT